MKIANGQWRIIQAEMNGTDATPYFQQQQLEIAENDYRTLQAGNVVDAGKLSYHVDSKRLDITGTEGISRGKTIRCIHKTEGDRLTVCYNFAPEGDYPPEFMSTAENKFILITYQRQHS